MEKRHLKFSVSAIVLLMTWVAIILVVVLPLCFPKYAPVVVAKHRIDIAAEMTEENAEVKLFPVSAIPDGVASDLSEVVGQEIIQRVTTGEFIFLDRLQSKRSYLAQGHSSKVISFAIDEANFGPEIAALQSGETVALSKNGKHVFGEAIVWEIDFENQLLELYIREVAFA